MLKCLLFFAYTGFKISNRKRRDLTITNFRYKLNTVELRSQNGTQFTSHIYYLKFIPFFRTTQVVCSRFGSPGRVLRTRFVFVGSFKTPRRQRQYHNK